MKAIDADSDAHRQRTAICFRCSFGTVQRAAYGLAADLMPPGYIGHRESFCQQLPPLVAAFRVCGHAPFMGRKWLHAATIGVRYAGRQEGCQNIFSKAY